MIRTFLTLTVIAALCAGCVEREASMTAREREVVREFLGTEAPEPQHVLDIQFRGIRLLGYDVSTETLRPGQNFEITWYWQVDRAPGAGWSLFTHGSDGREDRINLDSSTSPQVRTSVIRDNYQPSRWQSGQFIRDVEQITLPPDWTSAELVLYIGFWNPTHSDARLPILEGPNDGDNRARAIELRVNVPSRTEAPALMPPAEQRPPPTIRAAHTTRPLRIDGRLDEEDWNQTGRTARFVHTLTGADSPFAARARLLWNESHLYLGFQVNDPNVRARIAEHDGPLYREDAVEIMIDPDGDGRNYVEIQVSPRGTVFDARYDRRRRPDGGDKSFETSLQSATSVRGELNDAEDDQGYSMEIAIPWRAFTEGVPGTTQPQPNTRWRANFYVFDIRPGQAPRSNGWSPTYVRDFHMPARFGNIVFLPPRPVAAPARNAGGFLPVQGRLRGGRGHEVRRAVQIPPPAPAR